MKRFQKLVVTIFATLLYLISPFILSAQASEVSITEIVNKVNIQLQSNQYAPQSVSTLKFANLIKSKAIKNGKNNELVFILAGQSNMAGYGTTAKLSASYKRTPSNVKFYFNGYPAKMSRFARFGPEVSFAHAISRRFPHKKIKLIKFAVGGTSLFAWDPRWRLGKARMTRNASAGPLFKKLLQTIRTHIKDKNAQLAGVLWMQGETDARYPGAANTYSQNLAQFVSALRRELKSPNLAFFMGEIDPPLKFFPYREIVRKAQRKSSAHIRNSRLISTKGLAKRNDHLHYNTEGQLALGMRFAQAYIQATKYRH